MNRRGRCLILSGILASAVALPSWSFSLEPMTASLAPSGAGSIATFRLKNDGAERIAIKLSIVRRSMAQDGAELNEAASQLFTIYPARLVLGAASTATFKIQWKGSASPDAEQCFRLIAEQVPVEADGNGGSGIRILFRYVASLYVTPAASTWRLIAGPAVGAVGANGETGFSIEVTNAGKRHVVAVGSSFELQEIGSASSAVTLSGEAIGAAEGANYLPGLSRLFFIPSKDAVPGRPYEAQLDFTPEN